MVKKGDVKAVAIVVVGVIAAGLVMGQLKDIGLIDQARDGYDK